MSRLSDQQLRAQWLSKATPDQRQQWFNKAPPDQQQWFRQIQRVRQQQGQQQQVPRESKCGPEPFYQQPERSKVVYLKPTRWSLNDGHLGDYRFASEHDSSASIEKCILTYAKRKYSDAGRRLTYSYCATLDAVTER
ncbi:hypothetical protein J4E85_008124 [Alternaria conjuncta]|uniref:uncharacterized protein n=1 Tax=Alternaria conjuncta TaxID=181017 RepID=UPI0022211B1B|nr:uncharacterized protein J4E85_008124 [Alternaria conjuncta]KAI4923966.1 hypothetical protein J4E85_008124 [Alternaria conjuncta]